MLKSLIGDSSKDLLIQTYTVKPLLHSVLIDGKDPHGLCGALEGKFYEFAYVGINDPTDAGTFRVGETCAQAILDRIPHPKLPCINPLTTVSGGGGGGSASASLPGKSLTLRDELLHAINLLSAFSTFKLAVGPVRNLLDKLLAQPTYSPFPEETAIVNALVRSVMQRRHWPSLAKKIASLPHGRTFSFPLIASSLKLAEQRYQAKAQQGPVTQQKPANYFDDWIN